MMLGIFRRVSGVKVRSRQGGVVFLKSYDLVVSLSPRMQCEYK